MQYTLEQSTTTVSRGGIFLRLLLAGIPGILIFSFANTIYNLPTLIETLNINSAQLPPDAVLIIIATVQPTILIALAIWVGLTLSRRMAVNVAPILTGDAGQQSTVLLATGLGTGFIAGLLMLAVHQLIFLPITGIPVNATTTYPFWLAMSVALLYGGIVEELLMRLGLMTLLLWLGAKLRLANTTQSENRTFWIINIIVTLIFGLLHVASAPALMGITITPLVIVQALVLNSVGLLFGWLYWRKGLETAIAAHMGIHLSYTLIAILFL